MISVRRLLLLLTLAAGALCILPEASAQVRVDMSLKRGSFIRYEPVIATVTIQNLTGSPLELADDGNRKWFSFNIESVDPDLESDGATRLVPPYNPDYSLRPVIINPGESIKRQVNITPLYPLAEYGTYRIRATVYDAATGRYYSSPQPLNVTVTEGRLLWQQVLGTEDGGTRHASLLAHRVSAGTQLYLRIEDKENGRVYCTHQLGRIVISDKPDVLIGAGNQIHILQNVAPKVFLYTLSDLDGKILERKQYASRENTRPSLARTSEGAVQVVGGDFFDPEAIRQQQAQAGPPPGASDRPVPLPKPE